MVYAKPLERQRQTRANAEETAEAVRVKLRPGIVTVLPASQGYFNHLRVVGASSFETKSSGGINLYRVGDTNLLITFRDASHPADVAIRDLNTDTLYLLALMPQATPPRSYEIVLLPEKGAVKAKDKKESQEDEVETRTLDRLLPVYPVSRPDGYDGGYEAFLLDCLSKAALMRPIQGATVQDPWKGLVIKYQFKPLEGLTLYSAKRWLISEYEIGLYEVKNEGEEDISLQEPYLWQKGVLAVSFIRNFFEEEDSIVKLAPGESVWVLLVRYRGEKS